MSEVLATYLLTDTTDSEKRAEQIAAGLTVGSWTDLPLVKQEQLRKHKGRVVKLRRKKEPQKTKHNPSSPSPILRRTFQEIFRPS